MLSSFIKGNIFKSGFRVKPALLTATPFFQILYVIEMVTWKIYNLLDRLVLFLSLFHNLKISFKNRLNYIRHYLISKSWQMISFKITLNLYHELFEWKKKSVPLDKIVVTYILRCSNKYLQIYSAFSLVWMKYLNSSFY